MLRKIMGPVLVVGGMEFATGTGLLTTGSVDLEAKAGAVEEPDPRPSDL
jgi:hypothetical protein